MTPYTEDSCAFLRDLANHNDRAWYADNRSRFHQVLLEPTRAFVIALGDELRRRVHPGIVGEPKMNKAIRRLARDTRFSKDKTPFRTEQVVILSWAPGRFAPGFQVRLRADEVELVAGRHGWDAPQRQGFREALLDERGPGFRGSLTVCEGAGFHALEPQLRGRPRGTPREHPNAVWLRYRTGFSVHRTLPIAPTDPDLVKRCADPLVLTGPLVAWLDANARAPRQSDAARSIAATDAPCASALDGP